MKIKVIEDLIFVTRSIEPKGLTLEEFENLKNSFVHVLVKGDVWEQREEDKSTFDCIEGKCKGQRNVHWRFEERDLGVYFEIVEDVKPWRVINWF
jgi:hypothetical protein